MGYRDLSYLEQEADSWDRQKQQNYIINGRGILESGMEANPAVIRAVTEHLLKNGKKSAYDKLSEKVREVSDYVNGVVDRQSRAAQRFLLLSSLSFVFCNGLATHEPVSRGDYAMQARSEVLGYESTHKTFNRDFEVVTIDYFKLQEDLENAEDESARDKIMVEYFDELQILEVLEHPGPKVYNAKRK
jgi:hypothetical protein